MHNRRMSVTLLKQCQQISLNYHQSMHNRGTSVTLLKQCQQISLKSSSIQSDLRDDLGKASKKEIFISQGSDPPKKYTRPFFQDYLKKMLGLINSLPITLEKHVSIITLRNVRPRQTNLSIYRVKKGGYFIPTPIDNVNLCPKS